MKYYSETGERLPAEEIDLEKGYLVDRETVHHEAGTHTASKTLPGGVVLTLEDVPAIWREKVKQLLEQEGQKMTKISDIDVSKYQGTIS